MILSRNTTAYTTISPGGSMNDMKRFLVVTIAAGILAGCATAPQNSAPGAGPPKSAQDAVCLKDTGSRISANGKDCSAIGRSYSSEDISRTGATTTGGALQLLDPSITVRQ
jgi:uncharacterized lipoprotein YajG